MGMRILFASYTAGITGPTNSLLLLLKHLREYHEVGVVLPGRGGLIEELERARISFHSLPTMGRTVIPAVARLLRRERADLLYLNNTSGAMRNAAIAGLLARVPYVCHVREMGQGKSWANLAYIRGAAGVVAVSEACARSVERFAPRGRLHVVHNGVDLVDPPEPSLADRAFVRETIGLSEDALVILSVSHLSPRKGQEFAVAAMAEVIRSHPDAHLCLVGEVDRDPEYVDRLRREVVALGLAGNVHIVGFRSDLRRLYAGADIFLHTALADPHPRSVVEAMAAALPVVAFATDGVAETVVDGVTGTTVPQRDAAGAGKEIGHLLESAELRRRMGEAGRRRVGERFSAAITAARVNQIIESLPIKRHPAGLAMLDSVSLPQPERGPVRGRG